MNDPWSLHQTATDAVGSSCNRADIQSRAQSVFTEWSWKRFYSSHSNRLKSPWFLEIELWNVLTWENCCVMIGYQMNGIEAGSWIIQLQISTAADQHWSLYERIWHLDSISMWCTFYSASIVALLMLFHLYMQHQPWRSQPLFLVAVTASGNWHLVQSPVLLRYAVEVVISSCALVDCIT